ncbi:MAG: SsrA-binding protein SmpB [Actinomycetota bacterium]|nr:SsrA-binding protein SmpB [Actinomycetota bacterium]
MSGSSSNGSHGDRTVAVNRRARYDYDLGDRYEAGLVLEGTEVKSLRQGKASLAQAWVKIDESGEAWLMQAHIPEYQYGHRRNHDPTRPRKLLLKRRELDRLAGEFHKTGSALVPTELYFRDGYAKLAFAVGGGKDKHDKRRDLARRDAQREVERALKQRGRR